MDSFASAAPWNAAYSSRQANSRPLTVLGLMSGTSLDAIDACIAKISPTQPTEATEQTAPISVEILGDYSEPIDSALRQQLLAVSQEPIVSLRDVCRLNMTVGSLFAETALAVIRRVGIAADAIDCIGSHGQTIAHFPPQWGSTGTVGATLQIGEASIIAEKTGIATVADFRPRDMAVDGQGAPLVAFADQLLFQNHRLGRCIQNIGGIANVTVLPADQQQAPMAFDTGPGNMLMDGAMCMLFEQTYDKNGEIASAGKIDAELLDALLAHPFLRKAPPKTTGRNQFGQDYVEDLLQQFPRIHKEHVLATLTYFTAKSIADAYRQFVQPHYHIDEVIVGGGGAYNKTLMAFLREELAQQFGHPLVVKTHEDYGIPNKIKEPLAFAILAWATVQGLANNLPSCTGASRPAILGKISPGRLEKPFPWML
ncbi:MAG: anhydro-N-acetylmuramic acid kinase [Candidatus Melainabacteria bacterium]|nr:anhydro-N-acetylmuramic acid kinase [Candidatus Melainabacteria bacterium]